VLASVEPSHDLLLLWHALLCSRHPRESWWLTDVGTVAQAHARECTCSSLCDGARDWFVMLTISEVQPGGVR
jgi:hypothetical protein